MLEKRSSAGRGHRVAVDDLPSMSFADTFLDEGGPSVAAPSRRMPLSHKERLVLTELARGNSTDEIARTLYVSPHTVRTHIKNVMRKLRARTRAQAVAIALTDGSIRL